MSEKGLFEQVKDFFRNLDAATWPAFLMFVVVLFAAGGLNYLEMQPVIGAPLAIGVALFFGVGVMAWHIVESRKDDSKFQDDTAKIVKWLNAVLDGILLVVNLFRAQLNVAVFDGVTGWDSAAFVIVGISAVSHVVGYLLWTENDPRRKLAKEAGRALDVVARKRQSAKNVIAETEAELQARKWIVEEEARMRSDYGGTVPANDLNTLVADMKKTAMQKFEKTVASPQNTQSRPVQPRTAPQRLEMSYAKDVEKTADLAETDKQASFPPAGKS